MGFTEAFAHKILDHFLRNQAETSPTNVYVALFNGDPEDTGTEVSEASYDRAVLTLQAPANKATENEAIVNFGTAGESWGQVTHFGIFDDETAGTAYFYSELAVAKTVDEGDPVRFPVGDLTITLNGN